MYVDDTMIQSNLVNTETERGGGIESVRINVVSLLKRLNLQKMWGAFFPRRQSNSLYYGGVHNAWFDRSWN